MTSKIIFPKSAKKNNFWYLRKKRFLRGGILKKRYAPVFVIKTKIWRLTLINLKEYNVKDIIWNCRILRFNGTINVILNDSVYRMEWPIHCRTLKSFLNINYFQLWLLYISDLRISACRRNEVFSHNRSYKRIKGTQMNRTCLFNKDHLKL